MIADRKQGLLLRPNSSSSRLVIIDRRIAYSSLSVAETTSMKLSPYWGVKKTARLRQ